MNESLLTKKEGLSDQAYREIKSMILTNQLGPGAILNEAQFQEILGIGRTPVREAIIQLSQEGFLIVHPRRGMEVARISPKRIKDIFEIRYLIEPQILRMGFDKIDRSWLSSMREEFLHYINNGLDLSREDTIRLSELDNELHMGIIDSVGNNYASQMMSGFQDYLTLFRASSTSSDIRFEPSNQEHVAIIESILGGEVDQACNNLAEHLAQSYEESIKIVMNMSV